MKKYYWMAKPDPKTQQRLNKIIEILGSGIRTVRNIAYKLYPSLHGKALENAYTNTIKDTVKLRTSGLIGFWQIKEVRTSVRDIEGYQDIDDFINCKTTTDLSQYYSLSRRPSHIKPVEVWFEKETIIDDFNHICGQYDIPTLSVRGKPQWSSLKKASGRLTNDHVVLYFGDNDRIGNQIFGTIEDYIHFLGCECSFHWGGVTEEQEQKYGLRRNVRLDGLDSEDLHEIIETEILKYIDMDKLKEIERQEEKDRKTLSNYVLRVVKK
jgi:hypothetical protein